VVSAYGFLVTVPVALDGKRTLGAFGASGLSRLANLPFLVSAMRLSEEFPWSTVTLIARNDPSGALLVGL
jgi:hypothetical protein